jgi:AAA family ATP:ADP antiporter
MLNAWGFTALTQGLGLGIAATAGVGAVIALIWAGVGIALGRSFEGRDAAESTPATQEA